MLKITLVRSPIAAKPVNVKTVRALGLRKPGRTVYRDDTPSVRGMIRNVQHLLKVESVDGAPAPAAKPEKAAPKAQPKPESVATAAKPAAKKPEAKKPAPKKAPAPKKPAPAKPAGRKPETERRSFGELGKKKKES